MACINPNYNFKSFTVDAEPTEEQVKEYCRKRCLVIVDNELFNEMKSKYGYWIAHAMSIKDVPTEACSECGEWSYGCDEPYCPKCGAKMNAQET